MGMHFRKLLTSLAFAALHLTPQSINAIGFNPVVFHATFGSNEAIIVGTLHASRVPPTALFALAKRLLQSADAFAVESLNNESAERELDVLFSYAANESANLFSMLDRQNRTCVERLLTESLGMKSDAVEKLKKQHLSRIAAISWGALSSDLGVALFPGFDRVLLEYALTHRIKVAELEGAVAAHKFDRALSPAAILADVDRVCFVSSNSALLMEYDQEQRELLVLFETGKSDAARSRLFDLNLNRMKFSRGDLAFADNRNEFIAHNLMLQMKNNRRSVIAIGPMHLTGPNAVQILLEKQGVRIRRSSLHTVNFLSRREHIVEPASDPKRARGLGQP